MFPGEDNVFIERDREVPYDLAVFGNIDPSRTAITINPQLHSLQAGSKPFQYQALRDGKPLTGVRWSVRSLNTHKSAGEIGLTSGLYTPVAFDQAGRETVRIVVTASYTDPATAQGYQVCALLLVTSEAMAISPSAVRRFVRSEPQPVTFVASALNGAALSWSVPQHGSLVAAGEPTKRSTASIAGSAAGIAATYNYDLQNARLDWSEESGLKLSRTYYSTGEIRSETREQPGHEPATMEYHYSRQARLLKYVDVLEQDQVYDYKKSSGQLMGTTLGTTAATFAYNAQGQTERIETTDGPLSLKIKLTYDDQGREILREFDFGEGRTQQLSQAYNVVDQLIHRALTEGETVLRDETYDYDARGRLQLYICTGTQQPLDPYNKPIDMQIFIFDELDNLIQVQTTSPDGTNFAEYSYDNPLDPTQLSTVLNDHEDYLPKEIKLVYNDDGDMVSDEAGRTLGYDDLGRLISVSGLPGETPSGYTYDPLDVLASQSSGTDQQRRFYRDGEIHTLQQGSNSSTFMQADGRVLAEHQEGAGPKS